MPARILIIDGIATNRIVLNVKLLAAQYLVDTACDLTEARLLIAQALPDIILISSSLDGAERTNVTSRFCRSLKEDEPTADIPVIVIAAENETDCRLAALRAGAEDVMARPLRDQVLLARIRSLLRARSASKELRLREDTRRALSFAEAAAGFDMPGRVAVISRAAKDSLSAGQLLSLLSSHGFTTKALASTLRDTPQLRTGRTDCILVDGTSIAPERLNETLPQLVSELRSREETRHVGQIVLLPADAEDTAAILLDIGVDDVVETPISDTELTLRIDAVVRRTRQLERLRQTVRDGLRAAITDPLTGLYNRRYAEPHLVRLVEEATTKGTNFAIMALDIDHFKEINDTHGHAAGDAILVGLGKALLGCVRPQDLVARIGGEEFLVAMPDTSPELAEAAAERLRRTIAVTRFETTPGGPRLSITLSIGVAMATDLATAGSDRSDPQIDVTGMFKRADAALYVAKTSGRNSVNMALSAA